MQINTEKLSKLLAAIEAQANQQGSKPGEEWTYISGLEDGKISFARDLMEILK